jgi:hypothetical protein
VTTENDVVRKQANAHTHPPDAARIAVAKAKSDITVRAETSDETTSAVVQNCVETFPLSAAAKLPKLTSLHRTVRRKRQAPDGEGIPDDLAVTTRNENFVGLEDDNLCILTTDTNVSALLRHRHWFCDGTFDSAPDGFQLYTIHAIFDGSRTVPLVYCIARNKNRQTYDRIFAYLRDRRNDLDPLSITVDFEQAAMDSLREYFPNAAIHGCLFHFGQCLFRKIQSLGLQPWYMAHSDNSDIIKQFQALAFVPPELAPESFQALVASLDDVTDALLGDFLSYFETTWIGVVQRGRRRRPLFNIELWNVNDRVQNDLPRTNNSIEGWHRAFSRRVAITHPTLRRLVIKIRKEQSVTELIIAQNSAGVRVEPPRKCYRILNDRLKALVADFDEDDIMHFIRAVANNL